MIGEIYYYRRSNSEFIAILYRHAKKLIPRDLQPKFVFEELMGFCEQHQVIRPKYSTLQNIVPKAVNREKNRLIVKLERLINKTEKADLDSLLAKEYRQECLASATADSNKTRYWGI